MRKKIDHIGRKEKKNRILGKKCSEENKIKCIKLRCQTHYAREKIILWRYIEKNEKKFKKFIKGAIRKREKYNELDAKNVSKKIELVEKKYNEENKKEYIELNVPYTVSKRKIKK